MDREDEIKLRNLLSLWRQIAIGTWLAQAVLAGLYCIGQASLPVFGYVPWEDAPRMEFESEVACWRHLRLAKKTNAYLLDKDCEGKNK